MRILCGINDSIMLFIMKCKRISVSLSVNRNAVEGCCDALTDSQRDQSLLTTQRPTMAPVSRLFLGFLISLLHPLEAQTIIGSSSLPHLGLPGDSSPQPTKQTAGFWPSLPPRGRSDVPIRATAQDRLTTMNTVQQGQMIPQPTAQSPPSFISALSTQNLSSRPLVTQPTASRPRTDTASLALIRALTKGDATTKGLTPPLPTLSSSAVAQSAGDKPVKAGNPEVQSVKETEDDDLQGLGSGYIPTVMITKEESPVSLPTVGDEMAQYQPKAQTAIAKASDANAPPTDGQTLKPDPFVLTTVRQTSTTSKTGATLSPVVTQKTPRTVVVPGERSTKRAGRNDLQRDMFQFYTMNTFQSLYFISFAWVKELNQFFFYHFSFLNYLHKCLHYLSRECVYLNVFFLQFSGELTAITPSTTTVTPKETSAAVTLPQTTTATTGPVHKQSLTTTQPVTTQSGSHSNGTTQNETTTSATSTLTTTQEAKMLNQLNKTRQLGRNTASPTIQSSRTGKKWGSCALYWSFGDVK